MEAIAHSPSFAKKAGVPQSVGKDFAKADKGRKFSKGGDMAAKKLFRGKETYTEELGEAKAVAAKKVSPRQFAQYEKAEGHKGEEKGAFGMGKKIASGRMTPAKYAEMEMKEPKEKFARGGGIESKGKTKGAMVKMSGSKRKFAEGGMTDAEQEAADKAAGLAESNKEKPVGFFERMRMGNIDAPDSDAYKRFGAGRGAASRAARVPVEDAVPSKVEAAPAAMPTMGEDERPAATGMGAATVPAKPAVSVAVSKPAPKPVAATPMPKPAAPVAATPMPKPAAPVAAAPAKRPIPAVNELEEYENSKNAAKKETQKSEAEKRQFTPPTKEETQKGMEAAVSMLGAGASLKALHALAKKLANKGSAVKLNKIPAKGSEALKIGNKPSPSTAPYLKELPYTPTKISSGQPQIAMKKGGNVKKMAKGGATSQASSASRRGDGIATKGKTRGKMC